MVRSYDDPKKQESRVKLRNFIRKNLYFVKPSEVRVACLPGAEREGEEALEVLEVYDPLQIPRKNIVGLEYNRETAERLRHANLGIEVVPSSDLDFFRTTPQRFHVINLDYQCHQGDQQLESLEQIAGRHILINGGVLCTNYCGKRESNEFKLDLLHRFTRGRSEVMHEDGWDDEHKRRMEILERAMNGDFEFSLQEIKDSVTFEILRAFGCAAGEQYPRVLTCHPSYDTAERDVHEKLPEFLAKDDYRKSKELLIRAGIFEDEQSFDQKTERFNYQMHQFRCLASHIAEVANLDERVAKHIAKLLINDETRPYVPKTIERYSYNSNKNTLMLMDMLALAQHERVYRELNDIVRVDTDARKIYWNPLHLSEVKLWTKLASVLDHARVFTDRPNIPERVYLGSSWVSPMKGRTKITKDEAIELLKSGCAPEEIVDCYSGFTKMQLAAIKAHITMGHIK